MRIDRWFETWKRVGAPPPETLFESLIAAHSEPHRSYHSVRHLEECFTHLDGCPLDPEHPAEFELALWFHDAVYEPTRPDNEAQSAAFARRELSRLPEPMLDRIESLIGITKHDVTPESADEELLVDIDLAILGADPDRFDEYERQIREEYAWVPEPKYREARASILRAFVSREPLYRTSHFRNRLEAAARQNLARSIERLGDGH